MNISDLRSTLTPSPGALDGLPDHVAAFCAVMIGDREADLAQIAKKAVIAHRQQTHSDSVATLGFALIGGIEDEGVTEAFRDGADQLSGRRFFGDGKAAGFEVDGIALLGVAVGFLAIDTEMTKREWLIKLLVDSERALRSNSWDGSLAAAALGLATDGELPQVASKELMVAIAHMLRFPVEPGIRQAAWEEIVVLGGNRDVAKQCVGLSVFNCAAAALAALPVNGAGVESLSQLLDNISQSMSHWTFEERRRVKGREPRKWHIDHEYHVQNLLWTVLKPIYQDLVDEESLPKTGHKTPRFDLGVPSLGTIIEVKFMNRSGQAACAKIIEEVAADAALYLKSNTPYDRMIAFIWDNMRQTEEYRVLIDGLETLDGVEKAIVLPRPLRMS